MTKNKSNDSDIPNGDSFAFLNKKYERGKGNKVLFNNNPPMEIGDEVIIHPVMGISKATKSYPAKIYVDIQWQYTNSKKELVVKGIRENKNWLGAVINEYAFSRLEFVKRGNND